MTEGIMTQKVTPLLKCLVLFLFIFTAKVLTSRPNESHETRNGIHHVKPSYYVRTFTKYHHRRTIQWNNQDKENYWPLTQQEHPKVIGKRSLDSEQEWPADVLYSNSDIKDVLPWPLSRAKRSIEFDSKEIIESGVDLKQLSSDSVRENLANFESNAIGSGKDKLGSKNGLPNNIQEFKVKAAIVVTDPPTTSGPSISCLYKIHSVSRSVTPSYIEDEKDQVVVESQSFDTGPITETVLPTGPVQIEKCTDPRASCYTLWHQDKEGNITVLGQGCWKSSGPHRDGDSPCDKCTLVTARLPQTKFCCCTKSYCNADFTSIKEEIVTIKAESTMEATPSPNPYSNLVASSILALAAIAVMIAILHKFYCNKQPDTEIENQVNLHKGEVMGSGPDALATGLLCVDNLTLIEHIGQGKFGSVWSGTLGSTPVAVKLFSSPNAWQKEAAIYGLPHLSHPNILRYYGSDTRPTLTEGSREYLIVLELCTSTLRTRLQNAPLSWIEFATLAHGLSSALAHLHTPSGNKPCIVHRDVNSLNVLVTGDSCRLADFGLAHTLHHAHPPNRLTEAGTLRYLCPEALEGALDLSVCGAALQAVDVFALALVLWEMLWRTAPAHRAHTPPYALPYHHHGVGAHPTLQQMQTLVSRNKARPPLPKGPVPEWRALKIATDTCDECWDHDAEARLTALCVEERMNELKQLVCAQPPNIHDNKIQNLPPGDFHPAPEMDKNSNCTVAQTYDVTTPLLYPYPHIGRNACIERNTHTSQQNTVQLIHKSLKDITAPENRQVEENCLSMARTNRMPVVENSIPEIRSYQRPLEYIPNDVTSTDSDRGLKETNLLQEVKVEKPKWGIRKFFEKFNKKMETEVKLVPENSQRTKTSIVNDKPINIGFDRPANLVLNQENLFFEAPCLSPPNKTLSPTMMEERVFKEMPDTDPKTPNQIFAVIVPKAKPNLLEMRNRKGSSESINKSVRTSMSSQSMFKSNSESEDSTVKKRLSCDNKIISNSASSSRASINLELQYIDNTENYNQTSPYDLNSDCSSSEDEHLMLLSENGGSKITMQTITKPDKDVLKEATQPKTDFTFNKYQNKYSNFDNEYSDPNDKENLVNGFSGDNPVYIAALNGEIDANDIKIHPEEAPKPCLKTLTIKRQHSLEQVSELFSSAGDVNLLNPAGRVKTPGDLPVAVRRARRDRALQKGRASECNRLSLYDDRMMFGNSL